jgi:hypothetical protein
VGTAHFDPENDTDVVLEFEKDGTAAAAGGAFTDLRDQTRGQDLADDLRYGGAGEAGSERDVRPGNPAFLPDQPQDRVSQRSRSVGIS